MIFVLVAVGVITYCITATFMAMLIGRMIAQRDANERSHE